MPKPQYIQKFRQSWLQDPILKEWLNVEVVAGGSEIAKCKVCGNKLKNHYADLKSHALTQKHLQSMKVGA